MTTAIIKNQLIEYLNHISFEQQQKVLDFVRSLKHEKPNGVKGSQLTCFAGIFSHHDAALMADAVKEGCGTVDSHEW